MKAMFIKNDFLISSLVLFLKVGFTLEVFLRRWVPYLEPFMFAMITVMVLMLQLSGSKLEQRLARSDCLGCVASSPSSTPIKIKEASTEDIDYHDNGMCTYGQSRDVRFPTT